MANKEFLYSALESLTVLFNNYPSNPLTLEIGMSGSRLSLSATGQMNKIFEQEEMQYLFRETAQLAGATNVEINDGGVSFCLEPATAKGMAKIPPFISWTMVKSWIPLSCF